MLSNVLAGRAGETNSVVFQVEQSRADQELKPEARTALKIPQLLRFFIHTHIPL